MSRRALVGLMAASCMVVGCERSGSAVPRPQASVRPAGALSDSAFAALHERISEPGGYFDTDNLISNETGFLNVMGALAVSNLRGGAYIGVGPDQNYSYLAELKPDIAFMLDVRRDNALHHLLLKALIERAPTRVEFLAGLHGRAVPPDPRRWVDAPLDDVVEWVDGQASDPELRSRLRREVAATVGGYGIDLTEEDLATIARFHRTFMDAGLGLRFTSLGRPPRPYYPTYRQLLLETDADGRLASYLANAERYDTVRRLHLENRIVPVVGDLAGGHAVREVGRVLSEFGLELHAFYTSNVEFYLWRGGTFSAWAENLASLPSADGAVVIRSYFPNFGGDHPSAIPGYYSTQTLQPVRTVVDALEDRRFTSYWDVVTRDAMELRVPAGG